MIVREEHERHYAAVRRLHIDAFPTPAGFVSPYAGPHLMVLALGSTGLAQRRSGRIDYAPAFEALG
jgi:hypothetical protein